MDDATQDYGAWLPTTPEEHEKAELVAKECLVSSLPVIQDVLDWFDHQIAIYKNPLTIEGVNPGTNPETVKTAVLFAQCMIGEYKQQRNKFYEQFKEYITTEDDPA